MWLALQSTNKLCQVTRHRMASFQSTSNHESTDRHSNSTKEWRATERQIINLEILRGKPLAAVHCSKHKKTVEVAHGHSRRILSLHSISHQITSYDITSHYLCLSRSGSFELHDVSLQQDSLHEIVDTVSVSC